MHPVGFEPAFPESERPQTYAFNCAVTGIWRTLISDLFISYKNVL
jgi:hypothetical protein